jgi:hypothetical protein
MDAWKNDVYSMKRTSDMTWREFFTLVEKQRVELRKL